MDEPRPQRVGVGQALGHAGLGEPRGDRLALARGAPRRRAAGAAAASLTKPSRPASIVSPRWPVSPVGEVPARDRVDEAVDAGHQLDLDGRVDLAAEASRSPPSRPRRRSPRGRSGRRGRPRRAPRRARRRAGRRRRSPSALTTRLALTVAISSRRSGCSPSSGAKRSTTALREVVAQVALEPGIVEQRRVEQRALDAPLGEGRAGCASSGRSMPRPARRRSASSSPDGQRLRGAVEQPVLLERDHQVLVGVEPRRRSARPPGR